MTRTQRTRRRVARGLAVVTLAAAVLGGAVAAPASAATSQGYKTKAACLDAQRATGSTSFVRISRSCYGYIPQVAPGVWDPNNVWYRFDYVARTS